MKRILLLGIILAICILAFPQGVLAGTVDNPTGAVDVNAAYAGAELQFTAATVEGFKWNLFESDYGILPTATPPGNLYNDALTFTVDSTLDWHVDAIDTDAETKGGLTPPTAGKLVSPTADGFAGDSTNGALVNPLKIALEGDTAFDDVVAEVEIEDGVPANTEFMKAIDQAVVQADYSATNYAMQITFTATNAWDAPG